MDGGIYNLQQPALRNLKIGYGWPLQLFVKQNIGLRGTWEKMEFSKEW